MSATKTISTFTLADIEAQIFELEGIRIIFRAPARLKLTGVSYADNYNNKVAQNGNVTLLIKRIKKILSGAQNANRRGWLATFPIKEVTFEIVDGSGNFTNGGTHITTVRASYIK